MLKHVPTHVLLLAATLFRFSPGTPSLSILLAPAQEIIYPLGAEIDVRAVKVGDETLSVMEIWGAEYQENDCLLIRPEARDLLQSFCDRERCLMQVRAARVRGQLAGGRGAEGGGS